MLRRGTVTVEVNKRRDDDVRWAAMLVRRVCLLLVAEIERRYGLRR